MKFRLHAVKYLITSVLGLVLALGISVSPIYAQDDEEEQGRVLEEVLVTSTKRGETTLQDTAMSISAIGQQTIEYRGAEQLLDYILLVPNVSYRSSSSTGSRGDIRAGRRLAIRGIESGPDGVPTTAFYLDDAPVEIIDPRLFDVERVEVLRGPQGTLYGANSMGGTVRIVTNKPNLDNLEYRLDASAAFMPEGDPSFGGNAMINVPLGETFALRASGYYRSVGGFIDNVSPDNIAQLEDIFTAKNVNDETVEGARLAFTWQPTDALRITPSVYYQTIKIDATSNYQPATGDLQYFDRRVEQKQENEFTLANLEFQYDFNNDISLFSSLGWFDVNLTSRDDFTNLLLRFGLPPDPFQSGFQEIGTKRFTWETRLSGVFGDNINWIVGVFYMDEERLYQQHLPNEGLQWLLPPEASLFTGVQTNNDERLAIFGEVTWTINDYWDVTGGLRWFDNDQDQLADFFGFFNGGPSTTYGESSESDVSPKLQLAYRPNSDNMIYGLVAKGFRPGGPTNLVPANACAADLAALGLGEPKSQFDADTLWNYEAGYKGTLNNGRLTMNAAAFFMDWTDVQQSVRLSCGFGFVGNVGAAESKGLEIEFTAAITDNFTLIGSGGYTDAEFTETSQEVGVTEGDRIGNVAKFNGALSGNYQWDLNGDYSAYLFGSVIYTSNKLDPQSQGIPTLPGYATYDLRFGVQKDSWEIVLWGKNLSDERGLMTYSIALPFAPDSVNVIRPREFGITFRYFGFN
jgi:outer membrane receptor protein involved in Fe transport